MESRNRQQSRSLPIIKQKVGSSQSGVVLGRLFLSAKVCTSCVQPLGLFLSRGSNCPTCGLKVCKKCKVYSENLPSTSWTCLVCSKEKLNYAAKSKTVDVRGLKHNNQSYSSNIKRSWSISATNRGSPVLKAYTKYNNDDRGYSSLPRMSTIESQVLPPQSNHDQGRNRRQHNYGGGHSPTYSPLKAHREIGRRPFEFPSSARNNHQSTLYPYLSTQGRGSPASSINFIEDEYWDYYDYELSHSDDRSSCERSLGDSVEYSYQHFQDDIPPKKPARLKKGRSRSVGSYDMKGAQLKTCTVDVTISGSHTAGNAKRLTNQVLSHTPVYNSLPMKKRQTVSSEKENVIESTPPPRLVAPPPPKRPHRYHAAKEDFISHSLPRCSDKKVVHGDNVVPSTANAFNTLPKEWKIFKRRDNNTTTIVISGINSPPNPTKSSVLPLPVTMSSFATRREVRKDHLSRTYISVETTTTATTTRSSSSIAHRKFPIKEVYPAFPSKIQPFRQQPREMRPLLPLYDGEDHRHGLFALSPKPFERVSPMPNENCQQSKLEHPIALSPAADSDISGTLMCGANNRKEREVIIAVEIESSNENSTSIPHTIAKVNCPSPTVTSNDTANGELSLDRDPIIATEEPISDSNADNMNTRGRSPSADKNLWTLCDPVSRSGSSNSSEGGDDELESDSSFQSVVDNNSLGNNGLRGEWLMGTDDRRDNKDKIEFESGRESSTEEEDNDEELEQIRRLLLGVDTNLHHQPTSAKKEPPLKNLQLVDQEEVADKVEELPIFEGFSSDQRKEERRERSTQNDDTMSLLYQSETESGATGELGKHDLFPTRGMNSDSTKYHPRKYKSRVLIGLNDTQAVEQVTGEVEIVTGHGSTFVRNDFERPSETVESRSTIYPCRESPEGEESGSEESSAERMLQDDASSGASEKCLHAPSRSAPDGADAEISSDDDSASTPVLEMNSEDAKSESTDSWTEEVGFVEMDEAELPAPLDMTLHTICEESETESEYRRTTPVNNLTLDTFSTNQNQGLEKYFNFVPVSGGPGDDSAAGSRTVQNNSGDFQNYEESEFSDTFSESSFSSDRRHHSANDLHQLDFEEGEAVDLASGRLEKYFMNLGVGLSHDSDSVGSESETGHSVLENKKKVLKHHRRSAEYEDEHFQISEDDDCAFEQEGFDTIKKQRKLRKSQEDLLSTPSRKSSGETIPESRTVKTEQVECTATMAGATSTFSHAVPPALLPESTRVSVSRSNSFNWSSDEEVNLMMRSLRQLIKGMTSSKRPDEGKGEKLMYLENELIRLMKTDNVKTMVDTMSSDSEGQEEVYKLIEKADSEPELLAKVMNHVGQRLSTWMKDEEKDKDEGTTIKTAQSISSDLNDDLESDTRFSWKGSFESALAKRQSVGSSDSLDYYAPQQTESQEIFVDRSILRSSSLHHLAQTQPILEESESLTGSLSRLNPVTSSGNSPKSKGSDHCGQGMTKSKSLFLDTGQREVKSARYRPPGYFATTQTSGSEAHMSTPVVSHRRDRLKWTERKDVPKGFAVRGLMEFSMQYNYKLVTFEVSIKQCRDLAAVDAKKGRSDPYVKGYLLPDRSKSNKKKTKTKKNTLNPVFGETLKFPISLEELEGRTLWLSVWHSDMFGKNEFMGQVSLPLKGLTFDDINYAWYPLSDEKPAEPNEPSTSDATPPIDLILALKWTPRGFSRDRGNVSVLFKEAKGLKLIKNSVPSTFIKCCPLTEKAKKQKTVLAKRTTNPVWNATMTFDNIGRDGLEVTLYYSNGLNNDPIGTVQLNCDFELWRNMEKREGFWVEGLVQLT